MKAGPYTPRIGSTAYRAIELLRQRPPGAEINSNELARLLGVPQDNLTMLLGQPLKRGALATRRENPSVQRSLMHWRLGDGTPPQPFVPQTCVPQPKKPRTVSSEGASPRFNFRVNADVPSHAVRLASMHHPAAKPAAVEPVIPAGVKVQRGPSWTHDPRVQCGPGEQPYGAGFAAAGPGRDVTTGRAWA